MAVHLNRGRHRAVDPAKLTPPATVLTSVAEAYAMERLSATILNHSRRTYAFGAALGIVDDIAVDATGRGWSTRRWSQCGHERTRTSPDEDAVS
jgi:sugar lactone lactonase YvrE